jgi:hypothetical protein
LKPENQGEKKRKKKCQKSDFPGIEVGISESKLQFKSPPNLDFKPIILEAINFSPRWCSAYARAGLPW